mgnify:CR=1 FL=1
MIELVVGIIGCVSLYYLGLILLPDNDVSIISRLEIEGEGDD